MAVAKASLLEIVTVLQADQCDGEMVLRLFKIAQNYGLIEYLAKAFEQRQETLFSLSIYILVIFSAGANTEIIAELDRVGIYNNSIETLLELSVDREGESSLVGSLTELLANILLRSPAKTDNFAANKLALLYPCFVSFRKELEAVKGVIFLLATCMKGHRLETRGHLTKPLLEMVYFALLQTESQDTRADCLQIFYDITVVTSEDNDSQFETLFQYLLDCGLYVSLIKLLSNPTLRSDSSLLCLKCFTNIISSELPPALELVFSSLISAALLHCGPAARPPAPLGPLAPGPSHQVRVLPHPGQPARLRPRALATAPLPPHGWLPQTTYCLGCR